MLADLVKAGQLPPVDERLPREPVVLPVVEQIGQYGGTLRRAFLGASDTAGQDRMASEPLIHFSPDGTEYQPNILSKWEFGDGGKTITCHIREGVKWSDGVPLTADDFTFLYNDMYVVTELYPSFPSSMKAKGEPGSIERVDDFTVQFKFPNPYPLFLLTIAVPAHLVPKHYLSQFHVKYADKATLDKMVADAKFERWDQLFGAKNDAWDNPDRPTMNTWKVMSRVADSRYIMERNPYYFKVDPEGNQLPYIDRLTFDLVQQSDLVVTKIIAGEIDMQERHISTAQIPLLKENEAKGDYRTLIWKGLTGSSFIIMFNLSFEADPVIVKYITDKKFRQALSVAIDRDDFNRAMYLGRGVPRQAVTVDGSPDLKPEYATRFLEHDVALANKWLDELGLDKKDGEGYRIAPETGDALAPILHFASQGDYPQGCELLASYWKEVGIKVLLKGEERGTHYDRMASNELQISVWGMDGAGYPIWLNYAYWFLPWVGGSNRLGRLYGLWRDTGGQSGKEPTGELAEAFKYFDMARDEVDDQKRIEYASKVIDIASDNCWTIGTVLLSENPVVVKNNMINVPDGAVTDYNLRTPKNTHPEQYSYKS